MAGLQDRPRPGGFQEIPFKRNVPVRGPSGAALVLGGIAVTVFGFSRIISGNQRRRRIAAEKMNARIAITPLLEAEADRAAIRRDAQSRLAEAQIMSNVEGWKVGESVYNTTTRYVPQYQTEALEPAN